MRLIDADKLDFSIVKYLGEFCHIPLDDIISGWKKIVDAQPTAYDVDRVVERLEDMRLKREEQLRTCADNDMADYFRCKMSAIAEVIEIVKSGGIE